MTFFTDSDCLLLCSCWIYIEFAGMNVASSYWACVIRNINSLWLIIVSLCIDETILECCPFISTPFPHLRDKQSSLHVEVVILNLYKLLHKQLVAYHFPSCSSVPFYTLSYGKIGNKMNNHDEFGHCEWLPGFTWFPSVGIEAWTIHWESTTPIFSCAGYFNIHRQINNLVT